MRFRRRSFRRPSRRRYGGSTMRSRRRGYPSRRRSSPMRRRVIGYRF